MQYVENIAFLQKAALALGLSTPWVLLTCVFAFLTLLLFILWVCALAGKRKLKRHIAELDQHVIGLEAMTKLPPLHTEESDECGDSIVFASTREMRRTRERDTARPPQAQRDSFEPTSAATAPPAGSAAEPVPPAGETPAPQPAAQPQNVTEAVHEAIYASVSGARKAAATHGSTAGSAAETQASPAARPEAGSAPNATPDTPPRTHETPAAPTEADSSTPANLSGRIPHI